MKENTIPGSRLLWATLSIHFGIIGVGMKLMGVNVIQLSCSFVLIAMTISILAIKEIIRDSEL